MVSVTIKGKQNIIRYWLIKTDNGGDWGERKQR